MNASLCASLVRRLGAAVKRVLEPSGCEYQVVVMLDALPAHLSLQVLNAFSAVHLLPFIIPAKTTWALAPLDTHVFSCFKAAVQEYYDRARASAAEGEEVDMVVFVTCVRKAISDIVLGRNWSHAFAGNGFTFPQDAVGRDLHITLGSDVGNVSCEAPSLSQIEVCVPSRSKEKAAVIWRRFLQKSSTDVISAPLRSSNFAKPLTVSSSSVVLGRTRLQTRALQATHAPSACK